eukprot:NODE_157_length_15108_cov_0.423079.p6 type:complete len:295 gc:universal NODE_157_length_15108_cov_0.423079:4449-3565(-)
MNEPFITVAAHISTYISDPNNLNSIEILNDLFKPEILQQEVDLLNKQSKLLLEQSMENIAAKLKDLEIENLILKLSDVWVYFYTKLLPIVQGLLYNLDQILDESVRTLAIRSFGYTVIHPHHLKLVEFFTRKQNDAEFNRDSDLIRTYRQMLNVVSESLSQRIINSNDSSPGANIELLMRRASLADSSQRRKNSSSAVSRNNTLKGLFKQNSTRISFAHDKSAPKYNSRSNASSSRDIHELKDEIEKIFYHEADSPKNNYGKILQCRKRRSSFAEMQIAVPIDQSISEFANNDS